MITVEPVGIVRSTRLEPVDDDWDAVQSSIELADRFGPEALQGLDTFSHVEVVFLFDQVGDAEIEWGARRPRGNPSWPELGIFAQRAKGRPNRIGTTVCRVLGVQGVRLLVAGLDAVDQTPVIDIKPWMDDFGPRGPVHEPAWVAELVAGYWTRRR